MCEDEVESRVETYLENTSEEDSLGGEKRESSVGEGEAKSRRSEESDGSSSGSIRAMSTGFDDGFDEVEVLVLFMSGGRGRRRGGGGRSRRDGGLMEGGRRRSG